MLCKHVASLHRDISITFELETLCRDQPNNFQIQMLSLVSQLPKKVSVTATEQEVATKQMESDENAVVEVFKNKLKSDQAQFKLYLENLANAEDARARHITHQKLVKRRAGEGAARHIVDTHVAHSVLTPKDMVSWTAETSQFIKKAAKTCPGGPEHTSIVGVLDLAVSDSSLDDSMSRLASLIRSDPQRSIAVILLPWDADREIGKLIQSDAQNATCKHVLSLLSSFIAWRPCAFCLQHLCDTMLS